MHACMHAHTHACTPRWTYLLCPPFLLSARGGFGEAPKFPRPSELNLLLRAQLINEVGWWLVVRVLAWLGGGYDYVRGALSQYTWLGGWGGQVRGGAVWQAVAWASLPPCLPA